MGGLEEDRFCDQLEAFYGEHDVNVEGQSIEAYAIGLPSWTLVQEATYLATRLSSYEPDLIIVLSLANDITDNFGVTGLGALARSFSPEHRAQGSSVFADNVNNLFGDYGVPRSRSALSWDLSPASRQRWDKAMQRLERLVDLQQGRDKDILVSALAWGDTDRPDAFPLLFQSHFVRLGIPAPFVMTSFLPGRRTTLPHDSHPNRLGHTLLRDQYVHALHRLGWVTVADSVLPDLDKSTPVRLDPELDLSPLGTFRQLLLRDIEESIDFTALRAEQTRAFLGGLFPESLDRAHTLEARALGLASCGFSPSTSAGSTATTRRRGNRDPVTPRTLSVCAHAVPRWCRSGRGPLRTSEREWALPDFGRARHSPVQRAGGRGHVANEFLLQHDR